MSDTVVMIYLIGIPLGLIFEGILFSFTFPMEEALSIGLWINSFLFFLAGLFFYAIASGYLVWDTLGQLIAVMLGSAFLWSFTILMTGVGRFIGGWEE